MEFDWYCVIPEFIVCVCVAALNEHMPVQVESATGGILKSVSVSDGEVLVVRSF
jgi:hypothetical protein